MVQAHDLILQALENLNEDEFKKFKHKLWTWPLREGFNHIPRGILQSMDRLDLSDKIISHYLPGYGIELTVEVLLDMGMREEAVRLQKAAESR